MPYPSKTPQVVQALEALVARRAAAGRMRLPTTLELAAQLRVSNTTVAKALRLLVDRGLLSARPGRGILIRTVAGEVEQAQPICAPPPQLHRVPRWQDLSNRISEDILKGTFPAGRLLPLSKELCMRYETSSRPLRMALTALVHESRIVLHKRGYRVFQAAPGKSRPLLIALAETERPEQMVSFSALSLAFWHALEWECKRLMIDLELYTFSEALGIASDRGRSRQFRRRQKDSTVAGYFIWLNQIPSDPLLQLLSQLAQSRKRVSVLAEEDAEPMVRHFASYRRFRLFTPSIRYLPGKIVGNFLLGLGHRRVACFSGLSEIIWSRNRIDAIERSFASAGLANAVSRFVVDSTDKWAAIFLNIPRPDSPATATDFLVHAIKTVNPGADSSDPTLIHEFRIQLWRQALAHIMEPLFERALLDKTITAWVGVTDDIARSALRHLSAKGIRVPQDISVIGFDDAQESMAVGLTSYNFNMAAVAAAMLDHVLDGRTLRSLDKKAAIEIPGAIMERASTAGPR